MSYQFDKFASPIRKIAQSGFLRRRVLLLAMLLFASAILAQAQTPEAPTPLRITTPTGNSFEYPVTLIGNSPCVSIAQATDLFRILDSRADAQWDASAGTFSASILRQSFVLYQHQNLILYNNAVVEIEEPIVAARGQFYVPLSLLAKVLGALDGVESNASDWTTSVQATTPDASQPAVPPPVGLDTSATGDVNRAVEQSDLPVARAVVPQPDPQKDPIFAARKLVGRHTIAIDPQAYMLPAISGEETSGTEDMSTTVTYAIAERCRDFLSEQPMLQVVITRTSVNEVVNTEQRLSRAKIPDAMLLVCLRLDTSRFRNNCGYRLFTMHEAIDPEGRRYDANAALPGSDAGRFSYLPFENVSLTFAKILDYEMKRAGLLGAPQRYQMIPSKMLQSSPFPSVLLSFGYLSNPTDRERFGDSAYIDASARAIAQAVVDYSRWVEQGVLEMP
jgi:N-acetylmuramoyl-L-alanine amidase